MKLCGESKKKIIKKGYYHIAIWETMLMCLGYGLSLSGVGFVGNDGDMTRPPVATLAIANFSDLSCNEEFLLAL